MAGFGSFPFSGARATPNFEPAPNSLPAGALSGVPAATRLYQRSIVASEPTQIVMPTPENRLVTLTAPVLGWSVFVGTDSSVMTNGNSGTQLPKGQPFNITLTGTMELWALTDAPIRVPLQIMVSIILMAERQRKVG